MMYIICTQSWSNYIQIDVDTDEEAKRIGRKVFLDRMWPQFFGEPPPHDVVRLPESE